MKTKLSSIFLVLFCTFLTSIAQVFYKTGVKGSFYYILVGLALYGIGAVLLITALKGGDLTILYPIIATGYIWVSLLSIYFFQESMNSYKWIGVFIIVLGVISVGAGSKGSATAYAEVVE